MARFPEERRARGAAGWRRPRPDARCSRIAPLALPRVSANRPGQRATGASASRASGRAAFVGVNPDLQLATFAGHDAWDGGRNPPFARRRRDWTVGWHPPYGSLAGAITELVTDLPNHVDQTAIRVLANADATRSSEPRRVGIAHLAIEGATLVSQEDGDKAIGCS